MSSGTMTRISRWTSRQVAFIAAALVAMTVCDTGRACDIEAEDVRAVARVVDAITIVVEAGHEVRLAGLVAPTIFDVGIASGDWPPAQRAKAALEELVAGGRIVLAATGRKVDRYGRAVAQVFVGRGEAAERLWVQGELVRLGHARAMALESSQPCFDELLKREAEARGAGAGIWADPAYAVRRAEDAIELGRHAGVFQLVEGRVAAASAVRDQLYLNFGDDWRRDFTILVRAPARRALVGRGVTIDNLTGATVRVRGWIERRGGPLIDVMDARAIEIVPAQAEAEVEAARPERGARRRTRRPSDGGGGP